MSLTKKISQFFSSNKSSQHIAIAFQQRGISLCSIPAHKSEKNQVDDSNTKVIFKHEKANVASFVKAIEKIHSTDDLEGTATIVLSEAQSQIVQVDKPSVPEKEINSALKWQIKELVSISPNNMLIDYYDAPTLAGGKEKINVVCAPLDELKALVLATEESKVKVGAIITQEFAFANLLPYQNDATLLVCQQPEEEIVLIIVKQQQIFFHRRLRGFSQISTKSADEISTTLIDNLSLEIQRSTDYFERQLKQAPIKAIKVLLPIGLETMFAEKLAEYTTAPVSLLDLPRPYHQNRDFAAAIGATLENSALVDSMGEDTTGEKNGD